MLANSALPGTDSLSKNRSDLEAADPERIVQLSEEIGRISRQNIA